MQKNLLFLFLHVFAALMHAQSWQEMMENPQSYSYYETKAAFDKEWGGKPYKKHQGLKQFYRYETFMLKNMNSKGYYTPQVQEASYQKYYKQYRMQAGSARASAASWQALGPFNSPGSKGTNNDGIGRVQAMAFHPTDTNTIWAGASSGGLWKTVNNGATWSYLSFSWTGSQVVSDIYVPSNNGTTVYVATSDYNRIDYSTSSLLKSTDGGNTWQVQTAKIATNVSIIYRMLVHPSNTSILFVATNRGIYRSANEGLSWTPIGAAVRITDMEFKPGDPNTVYAVSPSDFYKSTDMGLTFTAKSLGQAGTPVRTALAVTAKAPTNVYVATTNNYRFGGFYVSTDGGANFNLKATPTTKVTSSSGSSSYDASAYFGGQTSYDWCLEVSPTDANRAFLGGVSLAYTKDAGSTWTMADEYIVRMGEESTTTSPHVDYHYIGFQPITNKPWVGCDGGVYKSLPAPAPGAAQEWISRNESLNITETYRIGVAIDGSRIVEGTQDNGIHVYEGVADWSYLSVGDGFDCQIDPSDNKTIYYSTQLGDLYKISATQGERTIFDRSMSGETAPFHTMLYMDYRKPQTLYTVHNNVWKTTDGGENWKNVTGSSLILSSPETFAIAPSNSDMIYFTDGTELYRSDNAGEQGWDGNSVSFTANDLAVHDRTDSKLWACSIGKVYESADYGQTWTDISSNLPSVTINTIVHVPGTSNELYVGTNYGVFYKANNGSSWELFNVNLPRVMVQDLVINTCTRKMYAATYGRGVWQIDLSLPAAVCCPKAPAATLSSSKICSGEQPTLSLAEPIAQGVQPVWYKDGVALAHTGSTLNISEQGTYTVLLSSSSCITYPTKEYIVQTILSPKAAPLCYDMETTLELEIVPSATPQLTLADLSGCTAKGLKALAVMPQYSGSSARPAVVSKQLDLRYMMGHKLNFDVAYVNSFSNAGTRLQVYVSQDCGKTFSVVFDKKGSELAALNTAVVSEWAPTSCADWKTFEVNISTITAQNCLFKFELSKSDPASDHYWGNNLYLDNICINGTSLSLEEETAAAKVQLFPNPASTQVELRYDGTINRVKIINILGQEMPIHLNAEKNLEISTLAEGLYKVLVETDKGTYHTQLLKSK